MTTEGNCPVEIKAPFILDGIFLVYDVKDLSRPVALVHSTVKLEGLNRAEEEGTLVGEEQWLLFNGAEPGPDHAVTIPNGPTIPITAAAPYPANLPFVANGSPGPSPTLFNPVPNGREVSSVDFFGALAYSEWAKLQRYAHFNVYFTSWQGAANQLDPLVAGQTEEMREVGEADRKRRCLSFGGPVLVENDTQKRTIVTALSNPVDSRVQFARPVAPSPANYGAFRWLVSPSGGIAPRYTVVSKGTHQNSLPSQKPSIP